MTCEACTQAAAEVSHLFHAGCRGCAARSIVRGPHFRRVQQAGMQDRQYRGALAQLGVTHKEVRAQAAVDVLLKQEQARGLARSASERPARTSTAAPGPCTAPAAEPPSSHPGAALTAPASQPPQPTP